jgi:hypothetical protein
VPFLKSDANRYRTVKTQADLNITYRRKNYTNLMSESVHRWRRQCEENSAALFEEPFQYSNTSGEKKNVNTKYKNKNGN